MQRQTTNSRSADKFVIRLPDGLRDRISEVARDHHRSMNSEIIARLMQSIETEAHSQLTDAVTLYLPQAVKGEIASLAEDNDRTLQSEITHRLKHCATVAQLTDEQSRLIGILQRRIEELENQLQMKGAA